MAGNIFSNDNFSTRIICIHCTHISLSLSHMNKMTKQKQEHGVRVSVSRVIVCNLMTTIPTNTSAFAEWSREFKMKIVTFSLITSEMLSSTLCSPLSLRSLLFIPLHIYAFVCILGVHFVHRTRTHSYILGFHLLSCLYIYSSVSTVCNVLCVC